MPETQTLQVKVDANTYVPGKPVAKFCREHSKILIPTWHTCKTGLRTLHTSLQHVTEILKAH